MNDGEAKSAAEGEGERGLPVAAPVVNGIFGGEESSGGDGLFRRCRLGALRLTIAWKQRKAGNVR